MKIVPHDSLCFQSHGLTIPYLAVCVKCPKCFELLIGEVVLCVRFEE